MKAVGNFIWFDESVAEALSPVSVLTMLLETPLTVLIDKSDSSRSFSLMLSSSMTEGSTRVVDDWSSNMARPLIDLLVPGWNSVIGHVLLNDVPQVR